MIILTFQTAPFSGIMSRTLQSASLQRREPVLLPGKKAVLHQNGGCGKKSAAGNQKKKNLTFHWRGGYLTREKLTVLLQLLEGTARSRGKYAQVSLNWPQAVLSVRFLDELPENELVLEEVKDT